MAINRSFISTQSTDKFGGSIVKMMVGSPPTNLALNPPLTPGQMIGYYNGTTDSVSLYVVSATGNNLLRVG